MCPRKLTLDFDLSDPEGVLPFLCQEHKNLGMLGQEKKGWSSPRNFRLSSMPAMPKIESRPCKTVDVSLMLMGGRFVAKTDADCFEIDVSEFDLCLENFAMVDKERQSNSGYVASFLAALEIFSSWPWLEVVELSSQVKSIQVDKGVSLLSQGDRVDGIHIIHRGEAQVEFEDIAAHRPAGTCDPLFGGGGQNFSIAKLPQNLQWDKEGRMPRVHPRESCPLLKRTLTARNNVAMAASACEGAAIAVCHILSSNSPFNPFTSYTACSPPLTNRWHAQGVQ